MQELSLSNHNSRTLSPLPKSRSVTSVSSGSELAPEPSVSSLPDDPMLRSQASITLSPDQLEGTNHVVKLYDAFADMQKGAVGIVMEYMGGGSLKDIVKAGGCQDEEHLANMAAQIVKVRRHRL